MRNKSLPPESDQEGTAISGPSTPKEPRQLIKAGLIMLTSAFLGGVAFAIWNKRQIASINAKSKDFENRPVAGADDDAIY